MASQHFGLNEPGLCALNKTLPDADCSSGHRLPRTSLLSSGAQVDWLDHFSHTFHASFKPGFSILAS